MKGRRSQGKAMTRTLDASTRKRKARSTHGELAEGVGHLLIVALDRRNAVLLEGTLTFRVDASDDVVQDRRRHDPLVGSVLALRLAKTNLLLINAHGSEALDESLDEFLSTRPRVSSKHDPWFDAQIDLARLGERLQDLDELLARRSVRDSRRVVLPSLLEHLPARVDQFDAIVGRWVVRGGDHDADSLAAALLGSEDGEETHSEEGGRKERGPSGEMRAAVRRQQQASAKNGSSEFREAAEAASSKEPRAC